MYFLGLDYSTQKLKAIIVDLHGHVICEESVDFDFELSHYHTTHGVHKHDNGVITAPTIMWLEATDILFNRLSFLVDLSKVIVISGSAQQHTTMFWIQNINNILAELNPKLTLLDQMKNSFSKPFSPTWMDSSTEEECLILENAFGGKLNFQSKIGSTLAKRFSGPQIMKAFKDNKNLKNITEFITLVSNGICSVFTGKIVGIDEADAAGTGLVKSGTLFWDEDICSIISSDLSSKLLPIVKSNCIVGLLSDYFVKRYHMNSRCEIVSFTGDNPSSVIGMLLGENDICISLGTSDTLFACIPQCPEIIPDIPTFVFPHPLYPNVIVTLLCYKNGSQTRQSVRDQFANGDWDIFNNLLNENQPGNNGIFGLFFDLEEIIPPGLIGRHFNDSISLYDKDLSEDDIDSPSIIRSLIEGQLLTKYYHFSKIFPNYRETSGKLLITGGASINESILQIASDIFNKSVFTIDTVNSAAMGSVYRAVAATNEDLFHSNFISRSEYLKHVCNPKKAGAYQRLLSNFTQFLEKVTSSSKN